MTTPREDAIAALPCGHIFLGGSRCRGDAEWHDGAKGKHPYKPIDRRSGTDRRAALASPTTTEEET